MIQRGYLSNIRNLTGFDDEKIRQRSRIALSLILHDYSRFSVSTIDKFFNRILTGFSYEANIRPDSEISLDDKINREEALDEMLSEFRLDDPIGKWLADYSRQKIDDTGQWNIRRSILEESEALTKEDFLQKESSLKKLSGNKSLLSEYRINFGVSLQNIEMSWRVSVRKPVRYWIIQPTAFQISPMVKTGLAGFY